MSKSFSSMQYEGPFRPGHGLSNWEVPRKHKEMPDKRVGKTQIVATDRGHLVPGGVPVVGMVGGSWVGISFQVVVAHLVPGGGRWWGWPPRSRWGIVVVVE